jgi:raffinose/stachyose/melibiose transport system permease protein
MAKRQDLVPSLVLLLPAFGLYCLFQIYPITQSIYMSFFKWKGIANTALIPVGFDNYRRIAVDPYFWHSLGNSGWFMVGGFLVLMPLSYGLALVITSRLRGLRFFKTSFFMPVILPITAVGLMWVYIFEPNWGLVNSFFHIVGLDSWARNWLGEPDISIFVVILVNEWIYAGFNMLIFAAGIMAIPEEIYEAARIEGASYLQCLRYLTLPMTKESFKIFSVLCVTGCLKTFDLVYIMTRGGPNHATEMPTTLLYSQAFVYRNFGQGNAIGVVILVLGLVLSILLNKFLNQET